MIMSIQASTRLSTASRLISARDKRARNALAQDPKDTRSPRVACPSSLVGLAYISSDFNFRCCHYVANNKRPFDCD